MISFITTLYNEQHEIESLLAHIYPYVDRIYVVDDGSTDQTKTNLFAANKWLRASYGTVGDKVWYQPIEHTGLCELGRIEALKLVPDDSWVIMLDADERFANDILLRIVKWIKTDPKESHMYFDQMEYIDGHHVRTYQKVKVFKKSVAHLPEMIHGDPQFDGDPVSFQWAVIHRKSTNKQVQREMEYLDTYKKLLDEGKIDEGRYQWFVNLHHFVR